MPTWGTDSTRCAARTPPPRHRSTRRSPRHVPAGPRRRAAAAVVVVGVALALLFTRPDRHGRTIDLATVRWEGPTDFLLVLPGDELLRTVPDFGRVSVSTLPGAGFTPIDSDRRTP